MSTTGESNANTVGKDYPPPNTPGAPPLPPEELAQFVSQHMIRLNADIAPQVRTLRSYFHKLKPGLSIAGYKTWDAFCWGVLKYTRSNINKFLAKNDPANRNKQPRPEPFDWRNEWHGMPEYENEDLPPHQSIFVHCKTAADVQDLAKLVRQKITPRTRFIWHPRAEKCSTKDMYWVDREEGAV